MRVLSLAVAVAAVLSEVVPSSNPNSPVVKCPEVAECKFSEVDVNNLKSQLKTCKDSKDSDAKKASSTISNLESQLSSKTAPVSDDAFVTGQKIKDFYLNTYNLFYGIGATAVHELQTCSCTAPYVAKIESHLAEACVLYKENLAPVVNNLYNIVSSKVTSVSNSVDFKQLLKENVCDRVSPYVTIAQSYLDRGVARLSAINPDAAKMIPNSFLDRVLLALLVFFTLRFTVCWPLKVVCKAICVSCCILTFGLCRRRKCKKGISPSAAAAASKKKGPPTSGKKADETASIASASGRHTATTARQRK